MTNAGAEAFGTSRDVAARPRRAPPGAAELRAEAHFATAILTGALTVVYAISGATMIAPRPAAGGLLIAVACLQIAWLLGARRDARGAPTAGMALNALLVAGWILSRTGNLPTTGLTEPPPVGLLDALCATASAATAILIATSTSAIPGGRALGRSLPVLSHGAIVLSVASLSALAGGHTHGGRPARGELAPSGTHFTRAVPDAHFYCRLL